MRRSFIVILTMILVTVSLQAKSDKIREMIEENPILGHYLDIEEVNSINSSRTFFETDPPVGPIHNIAEFEPMEGVLVRSPFGIPYQLIAEMSQDAIVTTIVANTSEQKYVTSTYQSNGGYLDNCQFLIAPSDSYWTRGYGPLGLL